MHHSQRGASCKDWKSALTLSNATFYLSRGESCQWRKFTFFRWGGGQSLLNFRQNFQISDNPPPFALEKAVFSLLLGQNFNFRHCGWICSAWICIQLCNRLFEWICFGRRRRFAVRLRCLLVWMYYFTELFESKTFALCFQGMLGRSTGRFWKHTLMTTSIANTTVKTQSK